MKTKQSLFKTIIVLGAFLLPLNLLAQNDVGDLFKSSPQDATKLVNAYMQPLFKGMGLGLATGWHNTAKTKNFLKFDLRVTGTGAFVPDKDKSYDVKSLALQTISPVNPAVSTGPTVFGDDKAGARMQINGAPTSAQFNLPQGSGINFAPAAQIQLTVGLPKNIDVSLRLIPNVSLGSDFGKLNQLGLGVKAEILPLIMGNKDKLVPFDLAVALGFTNTKHTLDLDVNNGKYDNQEVETKFKGFNAEAIISKKILFFTPFASVGYVSSNSDLIATGTYDFDTAAGSATFTNPVTLKNKDISSMTASLGFQLNLGFLRVYTAYTQAEYGYVNAGLGIGIGK